MFLNEKKQMGTGGAVINSVSLLDDYFVMQWRYIFKY